MPRAAIEQDEIRKEMLTLIKVVSDRPELSARRDRRRWDININLWI